MDPGHFWWGGWWMFPVVMPLVMFLFLLVVLYAVFGRLGCRPPWRANSGGYSPPSESAMDILKKRYAKGEITKDEFERIKKDLLS